MKNCRFVAVVCAGLIAASANAQEVYDIDAVVVSAGEDKVASETPQSVSVVDQEDLDNLQPTTIGDALSDLPGVTVIGSDRVLGEGFNIRGFGSDLAGGENRLIVQIDGATKYFQQYRMGSLFTDPELYKRVEVLRGPASSTLFGSGALAGVITLETKDASDFLEDGDRFVLRQKLEFSSNGAGFLTSTIFALQPTENFEVLAALNYRNNGDITDGNGDEVPGTAFDAPSGLVKGRLSFGQDGSQSITASYQHWVTQENDSRYEQTATGSGFFGEVDREVTDQTAILKYEYAPLDNNLVDFSAVYSFSNTRNEQKNANAAFPSVLFEDSVYYYRAHQLNMQNTSEFSGGALTEGFLTFGTQVSQQRRFAEATSGEIGFQPGGTDTKFAGFVQAELTFADRLTLIPGLRVEHAILKPDELSTVYTGEASSSAFSPKLAALFEINDAVNVFGSVAYTERLPVLDELFDTGSGNPNLVTEKALNFELGASFTANDILISGDGITVKGTLYTNDVTNLITRDSTIAQFRNVDEATVQGFELEGAYRSERFFNTIAYSITRGDDDRAGEPLTSIPADELALSAGFRLPSRNLEFGWRGVFAATQDRLPTDSTSRTGGYAVHDIYASWKPDQGFLQGAEMRFGIDNVTDKFYRAHLASDQAKGRTFKLSLTKTF